MFYACRDLATDESKPGYKIDLTSNRVIREPFTDEWNRFYIQNHEGDTLYIVEFVEGGRQVDHDFEAAFERGGIPVFERGNVSKNI